MPDRRTPQNYDDPNDHRNYENEFAENLPPINPMQNPKGLVYHDFDYIGYQANLKKMQPSPKPVGLKSSRRQ